jgi:hypothetical protein
VVRSSASACRPACRCSPRFLFVCVAEVVLAVLIWSGAPMAATLSWLLLPFELVFWVGFALPFGPVLGLVRVGLLVLSG